MASSLIFLQLDGIQGEEKDDKHLNWIRVESFHHAVHQVGSGSTGAGGQRLVGKTDHHEFTITKKLDKATPTLNRYASSGQYIPNAVIEVMTIKNNKKNVLMKYTFTQVIVSAVQVSSRGDSTPLETVAFQYATIKWEYNQIGDDGNLMGNTSASHNLLTQTSS